MSNCLCMNMKNRDKAMEVFSGGKLHIFHKDCPEHGISLVRDLPLMEVRTKEWFTKRQLRILGGRLERPVLLQVSEDGMMGQIEFSQWRFMTEDEIKFHEREKENESGDD